MKTIGAAKAKGHVLALPDEVDTTREPVVTKKHGAPVAKIVPMPLGDKDRIFGLYKGKPVAKVVPADEEDDPLAIFRTGSFRSAGHVISPVVDPEEWEALR